MKSEILEHIRAIAKANGGKPPGMGAFEKETGITPGQYIGRYWARWSEALKEAGFEPNKLSDKRDSNLVFAKLAQAFVHFGGVVTQSEMRLYKKEVDPDFPNESTVSNRFP
jgi:hypothetical protein